MYSSKLGRFPTTDPSQKSVDRMGPQTWNRYTYCYNNPLTLVDENGKWPTATHNKLLEYSFKGLTDGNKAMIKAGSYKTDIRSGGKPMSTLWPSEAFKHVMTPEGMTPEQAQRKAQDFLNAKLTQARKLQSEWEGKGGNGLSGMALMAVGEATHVYEDMTSPAHGFDKTYGIPLKTITITSSDGSEFSYEDHDLQKWRQELDEHAHQESGEPTPEQYAQTALRNRAFFFLAFGEEKFNQLEMSDQERTEARALAIRSQ